eukprot:g2511.t2
MSQSRFGFVSDEIVEGLQSYGNWKAIKALASYTAILTSFFHVQIRQSAIESLLKTIEELVVDQEVTSVLPSFIEFLFNLVDDPNFKIKQGSLETINALIRKLGPETEKYSKILISNLLERLSDPKVYVKEGCISSFKEILRIIGPARFLLALKHIPKPESVVIREEIVLLHLMVILCAESSQKLDRVIITLAFDAFKEALVEESGNVASYAIEGLVLLKNQLSPHEFHTLLIEGNKLPEDNLAELKVCLDDKRVSAFLNDRGFVEIKDIVSLHHSVTKDATSIVIDERNTSTALHNKVSLRSYPLNLKTCSLSQDDHLTNATIAPVNESPENTYSSSVQLNKDDEEFSSDLEDPPTTLAKLRGEIKSRENPARTPQPSTEGTHLERDSSRNIAARIDRIAKLLRRKEESFQEESSIQSSKSATMSVKRRENLNLLKMKQKERRTHSANAVLQRQETGPIPFTLRFSERKDESLPSIHGGTKHKTTSSRAEDPAPRYRLASRRPSRRRREFQRTEIGSAKIPDIPLLSIDDGGYESPDCVSIPASTVSYTRPGTYASGISTSPKTTICDISTTEPFIDAEAVAVSVIDRLRIANNARKKEVDWISQAEALSDARKLVYHHPQIVRRVMRDFVLAFVPALQQLRSTTSRTAITLCQELFEHLGEAMDHDLDEIVPLLLKKAGETSNAGRDTFLASEADKALSAMIRNVTMTRALHCLLQNSNNPSKYVRSKVAAHLDGCLCHIATTKLKASTNLALIDRIFKACVSFLEEGYQQTRIYGKRILWALKRWIDNKGAYERLIGQVEPDSKKRRVLEVTQGNEGPPPVPIRAALSQSRRRHSGSTLTPMTPSLTPPSLASRVDPSNGFLSPTSRLVDRDEEEIKSSNEWGTSDVRHQVHRPPKPLQQKPGSSKNAVNPLQEPTHSVTEILGRLNAKDWRDRISALEDLRHFTDRFQYLKEKDLLNVIDQLTYRLNDGNSKVVLVSLEVR